MTGPQAFALLGLQLHSSPTPDQIKAAYRAAAKATHPDAGGTAEAFRLLPQAQEVALAWVAQPPPARPPRSGLGVGISFDFDTMSVVVEGFGLDDFQDQWNSLRREPKARKKQPL